MSNDPVSSHFQVIRRYLARLQQEDATAWSEIDGVLEDLHVIYEEMQTNLEAAIALEQQLPQQNQYYYGLFHASPIAYVVTDAKGIILEANQAIAQLLNVPQPYLAGKPLFLYVAQSDRSNFRTWLGQFAQNSNQQVYCLNLSPRDGEPFMAYLQVAVSRTREGTIEHLKIGIFNLSPVRQTLSSSSEVASLMQLPEAPDRALVAQQLSDSTSAEEITVPSLPYALDGLRVLVADDEAGIGTFITALLESHGIEVKVVTSAAAALKEIEQFQPDILLSDIRLPGRDGYDLIRQIRALEARQGRHIPAAAITAYLDEDREKALSAGFEAYWYKLSQPTELVEVVIQLVEQATNDQS